MIDPDKMYFPTFEVRRLAIHPASYDVEQRREASMKATALNCGVVMEVGSTWTYYWADPEVPIGKVKVYCALAYARQPEYDMTLESADEMWIPPNQRETA